MKALYDRSLHWEGGREGGGGAAASRVALRHESKGTPFRGEAYSPRFISHWRNPIHAVTTIVLGNDLSHILAIRVSVLEVQAISLLRLAQ